MVSKPTYVSSGLKSTERAHHLGIFFQSYMLVQDKLGFLENLTAPTSPLQRAVPSMGFLGCLS